MCSTPIVYLQKKDLIQEWAGCDEKIVFGRPNLAYLPPVSRLTLVHLLMISVWMGLVLAETVIEFSGRHDDDLKKAAILHYRIDCFLEIPVVFAVLITGMILAARLWPLSRLLWIKMAMGLIAIAVNLYCAVLVILRYRRRNDAAALRLLSRNIYQAWIGIPFGMAAFYCGLKWMGMV